MKARFPLSSKIFFLAFLNLLLLAAVALVFARVQFHLEFGSFFFSPAEERVLAAGRLLALDLAETEERRRDELLQRYAKTYGVDFYLFHEDGEQAGGKHVQLPARVMDELRKPPPGQRPRREGPPPRRNEDGPPPRHGEERPPPPPRRRPGPAPDGNPLHPLFQVASEDPKLYWVGVRIPLRSAEDRTGSPGAVLMASPSFFGTPLFFDFKPWLMVAGAMIAVFALCWLPLIRGLSRSITQITRVTGLIAEGQFDEQLPEKRQDELGVLAVAINRMASRLAGFVTGQKRFLGDIAHELCSPIARIQFALGILEQKAEAGQREYVDDVQEEVRQISKLVSELLQFSKAGMQQEQPALGAVDVASVVQEAIGRECGEGCNVEVSAEEGVQAWADRDALLRAVSNLVRNALRYAGEAGPIRITSRKAGGEAVLLVEDSGPGLPGDQLERVFAPFYRPEASRNRALGGAGLGLAIVKSCVELCKGKVECRNRIPTGLAVEIRLKSA